MDCCEKYDGRYEITNPGLLKLPVEQIYAGDETKARNQCIQVMLRMVGYGENIGSGFPLILQEWEQKHWMRPQLIEQPELMQIALTCFFSANRAFLLLMSTRLPMRIYIGVMGRITMPSIMVCLDLVSNIGEGEAVVT